VTRILHEKIRGWLQENGFNGTADHSWHSARSTETVYRRNWIERLRRSKNSE